MIYIITSNNRNWWAKLGVTALRIIEGTKFSHVSLAFNIGGEVKVAESVFPRFRFAKLHEWQKSYRPVTYYSLKVTDDQFNAILAYAASNDSRPYSVFQIINIGLKRVLPFFARGLNHERSLICSEFVARAVSKAFNFPHIDDFDSVGLLEVKRLIDALVTMGLAKVEVDYGGHSS